MATYGPLLPDASRQSLTEDTVSNWEIEKENCLGNFSKMHSMTAENNDVVVSGTSQRIDSQDQIISKTDCETMCNGGAKNSTEADVSFEEKANREIEEIGSHAFVEEISINTADTPGCSLSLSTSTGCDSECTTVGEASNSTPSEKEIEKIGSHAFVEERSINTADDTPGCSLALSTSTGCDSECTTVGETSNSMPSEKERNHDVSDASTVISEQSRADDTGTFLNCDTPKNNPDTLVINLKSAPVQMIGSEPENQNSKCIVIVQRPRAIAADSSVTNKADFRPLAWDLYDTGISLVSERVCRDLIRQQVSGNADAARRQRCLLNTYESKLCEKNKELCRPAKTCRCGFQSESAVVIAYHRQFGGETNRDESFRSCCLCPFSTGNFRSFSRHMKRRHSVKAMMPVKETHHQCPFCPCEYKLKPQLERHVISCGRRFQLKNNLGPCRTHCDLPIYVNDKLHMPEPRATGPAPVSQGPGISWVSPSADFTLPVARFLLHSSSNPSLQLPRFHATVQQSEAGSYQSCILVPSLAPPSLPPSGTAVQFAIPQQNKLLRNLLRNMLVPSSQASFGISSNLVQNFPHRNVPPVMSRGFPNLPMVKPASSNQVPPSTIVSLSLPVASCPSYLSSNASMPTFLLPCPQSENGRTQVGIHNLAQQPCRSVFTPVILPSPASSVMSPFALRPLFQVDSSGNIAGTVSQFPNNTANCAKKVLYVRAPGTKDLVTPVTTMSLPSTLNAPAKMSNGNSHRLHSHRAQFYNTNCSRHLKSKAGDLLICEICDGFVKDRQSLLVHFQEMHKISLTDSIGTIPLHSCAFCSNLFFTMSGILRHFTIKHSYYDIRVKKFLAKCPLCGEVNLPNVVVHMGTRHHAALSLSRDFTYCGICFLNIGNVLAFETHMLTVHSELFLSRSILLASIAAAVNWNIGASGSAAVAKNKTNSVETGSRHNHAAYRGTLKHNSGTKCDRSVKCARCKLTFQTALSLQRHCRAAHSDESESCPLCLQPVKIGLPYISHMKDLHLKRCSVRIKRILNTNLTNVKEVAKTVLISNSTLRKQNLVDECKRKCVVRITRLNVKKLDIKSKV